MNSAMLSVREYRALAAFRYELRRFLRFSEDAARAVGLEPRQHQLLLAVRGMPAGRPATVGALADRLQLRHHSTVELVDRSAARGLVRRATVASDRRQVVVVPTAAGARLLRRLSVVHRSELRTVAGRLVASLAALRGSASAPRGKRSLASTR